jgi:hypothetical protein
MTTRSSQTTVTFQHAVSLDGVDGILPAGSYTIETEEEQIEMLSFEAYRRVSTTISLPSIGTVGLKRQIVVIDPQKLAAAQERDANAPQEIAAAGIPHN